MFLKLIKKMFDGFLYGIGFVFFSSIFVIPILFYTGLINTYQVKTILSNKGIISQPDLKAEVAATTVFKRFIEPRLDIPEGYSKRFVSNVGEFNKVLKESSEQGGNVAIVLKSGTYVFDKTIYIKTDNLMIMSATGDPYDVILKGLGGNLIRVSSSHFAIDGLTLADARNHLVQVAGESNASHFKINNSILQNAYEQFLKVSYNRARPENFSREGAVTNCIFQFTRGVAKNFYTGGIDALGSKDWLVANNIFRDLASPGEHISQHAVHFWVNSSGTRIINNLFIDVDRAIGLGMPLDVNKKIIDFSHRDGKVKGNVIYHSDNGDPYADTGIILEAAENTKVIGNYVYFEHEYPNAIEYRYESSGTNVIMDNSVSGEIRSRDGAEAVLEGNKKLNQNEFLIKYDELLDKLAVVDIFKVVES